MLEEIIDPSFYMKGAVLFSPAHIIALIAFAAAVIWIYVHRLKEYMVYIRWLLLIILVISELSIIIWSMISGLWESVTISPFTFVR